MYPTFNPRADEKEPAIPYCIALSPQGPFFHFTAARPLAKYLPRLHSVRGRGGLAPPLLTQHTCAQVGEVRSGLTRHQGQAILTI